MSQDLTPKLQRNLDALGDCHPSLLERICLPVEDDHIRTDTQGRSFYRVHLSWQPFDLAEPTVAQSVAAVDSPDVLLFGLGRGEQLRAVLESPAESILAWDRDPWLLRLLLTDVDVSAHLRSGRLRLLLGADLLDAIEDDVTRATLVHPLLANRYALGLALVEHELRDERALICAGTLFVDDLAQSLADEGFSCFTWDVQRQAPEELAHTAQRFGAQLVAAINYSQGLAQACRELSLPLLVWEIDPATDGITRCDPPAEHCRIFSYRRAQLPVYEAAGFPHSEYLPLAANPRRRHPVSLAPDEVQRYEAPVSFVGASMVAQAQRLCAQLIAAYGHWRGGPEQQAHAECAKLLDELLQAHRDDFSSCRVEALLQQSMGAFVTAMRAQSNVDPLMLAGEMVAADKRLIYVAALGQLGMRVWGDEGWAPTEQHGARYMGNAGHKFELNKIYAHSTVNVDIGRIYQSDIVTMRVFDVMACGGFVLSERNEALLELFTEGVELACYSTLAELTQKAAHYIAHPDEAKAIALRGQAKVRADHTVGQRVRHMLSQLP